MIWFDDIQLSLLFRIYFNRVIGLQGICADDSCVLKFSFHKGRRAKFKNFYSFLSANERRYICTGRCEFFLARSFVDVHDVETSLFFAIFSSAETKPVS